MTTYGLDYLGGAKYSDIISREHPEGWWGGFFSRVDGFGDALPTAERLLRTGRCAGIKFHLKWKDRHDFSQADIPLTVKECKRVLELIKKFPTTPFQISPWCEHSANMPLLNKLHEAIAPLLPTNALYVNTPLPNGAVLNGAINEQHGGGKPRSPLYNFSYDGTSAVDSNVPVEKDSFKNAQVFFFWVPQFNLRLNTNDTTPRPLRKAIPTGKLIDSVIYLKNPKGDATLPASFIWKSHCDQHAAPIPEPRALKPVLIASVKVPRFELVASNGQVIAVSSAPMSYNSGGWRYYFDDFGFHFSEKANRIQGHPICLLRGGGKVYGKVNPAFRQNAYRE